MAIGIGKTITLLIAMAELVERSKAETQVLMFAATMESAVIAHEKFRKITQFTEITSTVLHFGCALPDYNAQVVIGTPIEMIKAFNSKKNFYRLVIFLKMFRFKIFNFENFNSVYLQTRQRVHALNRCLGRTMENVDLITSICPPERRKKVLLNFMSHKLKVLLTTNVMSIGIDNRNVSIVINFDMPIDRITLLMDTKIYQSRAGRTGRFFGGGVCLTFINSDTNFEQAMRHELHIKIVQINISE